MNKSELIKKLNDHGIHQLRKGETLQDAIDYIEGKRVGRVGYDYKKDSGSLMSKNEIIAASNKEAFAKSGAATPPDYNEFDQDDYTEEDYSSLEDYRNDTTKTGELQPCQYCGTALLVDEDADWDILNCEDCHSHAIYVNCM